MFLLYKVGKELITKSRLVRRNLVVTNNYSINIAQL